MQGFQLGQSTKNKKVEGWEAMLRDQERARTWRPLVYGVMSITDPFKQDIVLCFREIAQVYNWEQGEQLKRYDNNWGIN